MEKTGKRLLVSSAASPCGMAGCDEGDGKAGPRADGVSRVLARYGGAPASPGGMRSRGGRGGKTGFGVGGSTRASTAGGGLCPGRTGLRRKTIVSRGPLFGLLGSADKVRRFIRPIRLIGSSGQRVPPHYCWNFPGSEIPLMRRKRETA